MKKTPSHPNEVLSGLVLPVLGVCVVLYFAFHAIQGDRGIRALLDYTSQIEMTQSQLDQIKTQRLELEHRVSLMRPETLDPDLLDERVRVVLNYAYPDEKVILLNRP